MEKSYLYLWILKTKESLEEAARKSPAAIYLEKIRPVQRSQLNGKNKNLAIKSYTCK